MSDQTPNLSLPFIQAAQAQKHVTHNEAIELLDIIVQLTLESTDATVPPVSPVEGQAWGLGVGAGGDWSGQDNMIATWRGGGWLFVLPRDGWCAWVRDTTERQVWTSAGWVTHGDPDLENLAGIGINMISDSINRLSVSSPAILLNHEGAGHQLKINKSGAGDTGSLVYQTGFSGRAEIGLAGNDDFSIKVSADGATWLTAMSVSASDGNITISQVLNLAPGAAPANPAAGDMYFDNAASKLRCYDGTIWRDLF